MPQEDSFPWIQVVPWVLVIVGWVIVNFQNNERERRKELRSKVDALKKALDDLEDAAIQHHTVEQTSLGCMKIKRVLTRLNKESQVLAAAGLVVEKADNALMRLRQAITLRNFDSKRYVALSASDGLIAEIGASCDNLRFLLEMSYTKKFHAGWFVQAP